MARCFKCDRCGEIYIPESGMSAPLTPVTVGVYAKEYNRQETATDTSAPRDFLAVGKGNAFDLCPTCVKALRGFFFSYEEVQK